MGKRKVWTEKDKIDLVQYLKQNMTWRDIANKSGVNPWQVQSYAHSLDMHNKGPYLEDGLQISTKVDGVLYKQIEDRAKQLGITRSQLIRDILREAFSKRRHTRKDIEEGSN